MGAFSLIVVINLLNRQVKKIMVCAKCESKLSKIITPDTWKDGARSTTGGGGRKLNENKALSGKKQRFTPYGNNFHKCRVCKQSLHQSGAHSEPITVKVVL